ncbi:MAG: ARMT1-like domain-containing protein [Clostridia bacterium]|nr:ARMT1-like domain-containing protein [Clostridia bacterium]
MEVLRFNTSCISCIFNKFLKSVPSNTDEFTRLRYAKDIMRIIADANDNTSAPEIVAECTKLKNETFGVSDDFAELKLHFNQLMLSFEKDISLKISRSTDRIRSALYYALLGNYIDFGAMDNVDEGKLSTLIDEAENINIDTNEFLNLCTDLKKSHSLVYLTDNCGEIVFDKLFINEIIRQFPNLKVTVLVRGENVLNDATLQDAKQVGLTEIVPVLGNGTGIAGTCIDLLPNEIREIVCGADVLIAKGQGNFETLCYSHKNIYYLFMCKCKLFSDRFHVEPLSPMLLNDLRIKQIT